MEALLFRAVKLDVSHFWCSEGAVSDTFGAKFLPGLTAEAAIRGALSQNTDSFFNGTAAWYISCLIRVRDEPQKIRVARKSGNPMNVNVAEEGWKYEKFVAASSGVNIRDCD